MTTCNQLKAQKLCENSLKKYLHFDDSCAIVINAFVVVKAPAG